MAPALLQAESWITREAEVESYGEHADGDGGQCRGRERVEDVVGVAEAETGRYWTGHPYPDPATHEASSGFPASQDAEG